MAFGLTDTASRGYALISGELEMCANERVGMVMSSPDVWQDVFPSRHTTVEHQDSAFRSLCGIGAQVDVKVGSGWVDGWTGGWVGGV